MKLALEWGISNGSVAIIPKPNGKIGFGIIFLVRYFS